MQVLILCHCRKQQTHSSFQRKFEPSRKCRMILNRVKENILLSSRYDLRILRSKELRISGGHRESVREVKMLLKEEWLKRFFADATVH